jgi:hypothetical protein
MLLNIEDLKFVKNLINKIRLKCKTPYKAKKKSIKLDRKKKNKNSFA